VDQEKLHEAPSPPSQVGAHTLLLFLILPPSSALLLELLYLFVQIWFLYAYMVFDENPRRTGRIDLCKPSDLILQIISSGQS
jgi:hypothetical protein